MADARYGSLPFKESIAYFRDKLNLGTAAWTDIWEGQHARAFVVAGAMKEDLLTDFRGAIDKAIADGTTLEAFRKDFDAIVARHGWSYKGGRGWRTRVIYETNLRAAYQAGRYKQLTDPDLLNRRPYWRYEHSDLVAHPREQHLAWDGLVLRHDHPFWRTHFPPNGWGCRCSVHAESERTLRRLGKDGPDDAPAIEYESRTVGARGPSPRTVDVPKGIDPGWSYNVGEAAWGRPLAEQAMAEWRAAGADAWEALTPGTWADAARPARVPLDPPRAQLAPRAEDAGAMEEALRRLLGGEQKVYTVAGAPVLVESRSLAAHVDPNRSEFLPFIEETLTDPFEVWLAFERHKGSGRVRLRSRIIKGLDVGSGRAMLAVAAAANGVLEALTIIPTTDERYVQRQRRGLLLKGRR